MAARHGQHVADTAAFEFVTQAGIGAVHFIRSDPRRAYVTVERPDDHLLGQCGLGREVHLIGNTGSPTTLGVVRP